MKLPSQADVAARRVAMFKERLLKTLTAEDLELHLSLVEIWRRKAAMILRK
jgi:hypothetical protein